jgi:biotin carboxylase
MTSIDRHGMPSTTVLAQEFLEGDEYFVNTVSRGGKHHTVEICRYYKLRIPGGHIISDYNEPLAPDDPVAKELESYTHQVLDALEVHNAAGHTEVMLTPRGPVLVESAARMGGGQVLDINTRCYGTNQVELLALSVAKPDEFDRLPTTVYQLVEHHRFVHLINPREHGTIPSHEAMAAIRALPSHVFTVMRHSEGQPLSRTIDIATQPGFVFLISEDPAQTLADYQKLRQLERDYLYDDSPDRESAEEAAMATQHPRDPSPV